VVLAEEGYRHDSSLRPRGRLRGGTAGERVVHRVRTRAGELWEVPPSSVALIGGLLPVGDIACLRRLPPAIARLALARAARGGRHPLVLSLTVWELDPAQPRIAAASALIRLRHYRGLDRAADIVAHHLARHRFQPVAAALGLGAPTTAAEPRPARSSPAPVIAADRAAGGSPGPGPRTSAAIPVTIVTPCFDEEATLPYLANTLTETAALLGNRYAVRFVLVDDGSRDGTWAALGRLFGGRPDYTLVRHERNRGVGAAILTGIRSATTEVVCSIDCDCSYDPAELGAMIPRLAGDVAMVTASPYHPQGAVRHVPRWRLALSRAAQALYRRVLRQRLWTYTSCFRVYRRSAVAAIELREGGFLGVVELLGRLDLAGQRVVEHPATLDVRLVGHSKMRTLRTIAGHVRLMLHLASCRLRAPRAAATPALAALAADKDPSAHSRPSRAGG
jgi:hypothetical protein